jgi:Uma2 family endonuclease
MTTEPRRARVTWRYPDLRLMPEDGQRYEIIDGELVVTPSPTTIHQAISKRIGFQLMLQVEQEGHGIVFYAPVDVRLSDTRVVQPDLLVLRPGRRPFITKRAVECAPDLIIEIGSPSTEERDRTTKQKLYASEGVGEYWLVDPEQHTIEVLLLGAEGEGYSSHGVFGPGQTVASVTFEVAFPVDPVFAP